MTEELKDITSQEGKHIPNCDCAKVNKFKDSSRRHSRIFPSHQSKFKVMFTVYISYIAPIVLLALQSGLLPTSAFIIPENPAGPSPAEMEKNESKAEGRSLQITDWLRRFLDLPMRVVQQQQQDTGNEDGSSSQNETELIMDILKNVKIDRNSIFPVQFYNADIERGGDENDTEGNSTEMPNVIFGSPICLGLCWNGQFYAENTSVRLLSDRQFSIFGPRKSHNDSKTPPVSDIDDSDISPTIIPIIRNGTLQTSESPEEEKSSSLAWLSSWSYDVPLNSAVRLSHRFRNRLAQLSYYNPLTYIG